MFIFLPSLRAFGNNEEIMSPSWHLLHVFFLLQYVFWPTQWNRNSRVGTHRTVHRSRWVSASLNLGLHILVFFMTKSLLDSPDRNRLWSCSLRSWNSGEATNRWSTNECFSRLARGQGHVRSGHVFSGDEVSRPLKPSTERQQFRWQKPRITFILVGIKREYSIWDWWTLRVLHCLCDCKFWILITKCILLGHCVWWMRTSTQFEMWGACFFKMSHKPIHAFYLNLSHEVHPTNSN